MVSRASSRSVPRMMAGVCGVDRSGSADASSVIRGRQGLARTTASDGGRPTEIRGRGRESTRSRAWPDARGSGRRGGELVELLLQRARRRRELLGAPSKTMRPSWMNSTRSATGSTSWRMWVETRIVLDRPSSRISWRTPPIWFGSRPAGRLVHDQHVGVVQQRLGHRHPLAVSLGELADRLVGDRRQRAELDDRLDPLPEPTAGRCPGPRPKNSSRPSGSCRDRAGRSRAGSRGARPRRSGRPARRCRRSAPGPCVGAMKPVSSRIVVVLPAPLGPRKATTCP